MFGFGKKKDKATVETNEKDFGADKMPAGMKETAQRMMSGQFDMNDMLAQLKQIKKMSNFSGLLKMVPGMSGAVSAMKEKIKDMKHRFDASEHGGAPILGLRKPVIKAHGNSNAKAFSNALPPIVSADIIPVTINVAIILLLILSFLTNN